MSTLILVVLMQLAGAVVIIAEVVLPSGGLLSLLAIGLFGYSLYVVFHDISAFMGMVFVAADVVLVPLVVLAGFKLLSRSPATLRDVLSRDGGVSSQAPELADYLHRRGRTVTALRPSGTAVVEGRRLDVVSRGEYIEKGATVEVIKVSGNRVVVVARDS